MLTASMRNMVNGIQLKKIPKTYKQKPEGYAPPKTDKLRREVWNFCGLSPEHTHSPEESLVLPVLSGMDAWSVFRSFLKTMLPS